MANLLTTQLNCKNLWWSCTKNCFSDGEFNRVVHFDGYHCKNVISLQGITHC